MTMNTTTTPAASRLAAREALTAVIANTLERIQATPADKLDLEREAKNLISEVEAWTVGRHGDSFLIFRDPADDITMEAI